MGICSEEVENHDLIVMEQVLEAFQVFALVIQELTNKMTVYISRPAWIRIRKEPSLSIVHGLIHLRFKIINWVIVID